MGYVDGDHMGGVGFFGTVLAVALAGAIWVALLVLLLRGFADPMRSRQRAEWRVDGPEETLRLRFARGEIDATQLAAMREALADERGRHT